MPMSMITRTQRIACALSKAGNSRGCRGSPARPSGARRRAPSPRRGLTRTSGCAGSVSVSPRQRVAPTCRWWPGTPSWYAVETSVHFAKRVRVPAGHHAPRPHEILRGPGSTAQGASRRRDHHLDAFDTRVDVEMRAVEVVECAVVDLLQPRAVGVNAVDGARRVRCRATAARRRGCRRARSSRRSRPSRARRDTDHPSPTRMSLRGRGRSH